MFGALVRVLLRTNSRTTLVSLPEARALCAPIRESAAAGALGHHLQIEFVGLAVWPAEIGTNTG